MNTPRFDTLEELTAYYLEHRDFDRLLSMMLSGVEITEDFTEEAGVDRPGWYLVRDDLRILPLKHRIHRRPMGVEEPRPKFPDWACAAPE